MAVVKGTSVCKVPVFSDVVVLSDSKRQTKNIEKNKLIIEALGNVTRIFLLDSVLNRTKGNKTSAEPTKRNSVRDIGCIMPDTFSETIKDPAIKRVASNTSR